MQVWSTRKRTVEETPKATAKGGGQSATEAWALRVLAGVHAGAERKLQESSFLMIGSSDDCDLIFSDTGVAAHHCIVTRNGGDLAVRAIDAEMRIDDRVLHPGDPQEISPFSLLRIGGACFALGPHWSERWQSLLSQIEPSPRADAAEQPARQRSNRLVTLGVAMVLMGASAGALLLAQNNAKPPPAQAPAAPRDGELRSLVEELGYKGLNVGLRGDGRLIVTGYVESSEDLTKLRTQLEQRGLKPEVEAKSGPRIAENVAEELRMGNFHATAQWKGDGRVRVRGRFGDEVAIMDFLGKSRTMKEFNENLKLTVELENLDTPPAEAKSVPDSKRIRKIVEGTDPYLVSADKSVYYVGAKLPQGGTFAGIENGEILVRDGAGNTQRLSRESVIGAPSP